MTSNNLKKCLPSPVCILFVILGVFLQSAYISCYNLSPKPNVVFKDPHLTTFLPKVESSYFGFTINLRPLGIIIGAPRAQSSIDAQRSINETGAIYRCYQNTTCYPYIFEDRGNLNKPSNPYTYDSERRDHQWLGGSMDGGTRDTDKLIVCAPKFITPTDSDYLLHGICYWINDTLSNTPQNTIRINPLQLKSEQTKTMNGNRIYYYMMAEQGFSVHVTPDNEEFIIGAPGLSVWRGSLIRYREQAMVEDPNLSRRDVEGRRVIRQSQNSSQMIYETDILHPESWEQPGDSYFGYGVTSGYFDSEDIKRVLYVATAPQANEQAGEAYLFDISQNTINKYSFFRGTLFGEYFGYSVLAEDLNNDGLTDLIISAPLHSTTGLADEGAIYVFLNKGRFQFERKIYLSPVHGTARFGTTLTKLGDINHDGYNDIAVGAPFALTNGAVFIYLGGEKGLREKPSQQLNSPQGLHTIYGANMFGHGLSKGSDIDKNGFNDLAIGAPNAEGVFLYRAYPVIKVHTSISSQSREIKPDQTRFLATVCYGFSTTSPSIRNQPMTLRVVMDPQVQRVKIIKTQTNTLTIDVTAEKQKQCQVIDCEVRYSAADIFKPIELEVHHEIHNGVPDSEIFCDSCVAIDPDEPNVNKERIIFSTGCATDICVADLSVKSVDLSKSYIMGSSRTLTANYEVVNNGETAYLPQINFTSSNRMPFARVPSHCKTDNNVVLICDLNNGQAMTRGSKDRITVIYEVNDLTGKEMVLTAKVFSTGKEQNPENNVARDIIVLKEFTQVDVVGKSQTPLISLANMGDTAEIRNFYEIKSNGPSTVNTLEIVFTIPIAYKIPSSTENVPIVDLNNITMQATRDSLPIRISFTQNNTELLLNNNDVSLAESLPFDEYQKNTSLTDYVATASVGGRRTRRDVLNQNGHSDRYARLRQSRTHDIDKDLKDLVPMNKTIVFGCHDTGMVDCVRAVLRVYNFKPEKSVIISLKYNVDLKEVDKILIDPWEFFVVMIGVNVYKIGNEVDPKSLAVKQKIEHNIISKKQASPGIPIWAIILAVLGGLLLLALMIFGMYKMGFFKRAKKEEMADLLNEHQGTIQPEAEPLNADRH